MCILICCVCSVVQFGDEALEEIAEGSLGWEEKSVAEACDVIFDNFVGFRVNLTYVLFQI